MKHPLTILFLFLLIVPLSVQGLETYSDGTVTIDQPIADDLIVSGGIIEINAPVESLIAAGGTIEVNAPVEGDVIAAGGTVTLNSDIGGKAVLAGGTIMIHGNVSRNLLAYGGEVQISSSSTIGRDAAISGGTVINRGNVIGSLHASGENVENTGSAGVLDIQEEEKDASPGLIPLLLAFVFAIGMLILGLALLRLVPKKFLSVTGGIHKRPVLSLALGVGGLIGGVIVIILLMITLVGMPIALMLLLGLLAGLLLSTIFVAFVIGDVICGKLNLDWKDWQKYLLGFIILFGLFMIPLAGVLVLVLAVFTGFGGILYALYENREQILEKSS